MTDAPVARPSGRVIVIDDRDRVLLFRCTVENPPELWITPGGGCEPGETLEAAARRELWEETGIAAPAALGRPVWRRRHVWRWNGRATESLETFFLLRVAGPLGVAPQAHDPVELSSLHEHRWFTLAELGAIDEGAEPVPRRMAEFLEPLLRGEIPGEPVDVGV